MGFTAEYFGAGRPSDERGGRWRPLPTDGLRPPVPGANLRPSKAHAPIRTAPDAVAVHPLVDKYGQALAKLAALNQQRKDCEEELETLQQQIVAHARQHGLTEVCSATRRFRISTEIVSSLPTKRVRGDYARLDQALRASPHWKTVSCLDRFAVMRIWNGRQADPGDVRSRIAPFVETREKVKLVAVPHDNDR